ncbi:hypothetical protein D3C77_768990 [compost metagenome]
MIVPFEPTPVPPSRCATVLPVTLKTVESRIEGARFCALLMDAYGVAVSPSPMIRAVDMKRCSSPAAAGTRPWMKYPLMDG